MKTLLYLLLLAGGARAQTTGSITGIVVTTEDGGVAVPKAPVKAKNAATGASYSAQSSEKGAYTLSGLAPGSYEITIEYPPIFVPFSRKDVQVRAGKTVRLDI